MGVEGELNTDPIFKKLVWELFKDTPDMREFRELSKLIEEIWSTIPDSVVLIHFTSSNT